MSRDVRPGEAFAHWHGHEPLPSWRRLVGFGGRAQVVRTHVKSPRWHAAPLRIALLADLHAGAPWIGLGDVSRWVESVNRAQPDIVMILGDFLPDRRMPGWALSPERVAQGLSALEAPLGVHTILGNHDWFDDRGARRGGFHHTRLIDVLTDAGMPPLVNGARAVRHQDQEIWLVGFDSQRAPAPGETKRGAGRHDPERAFAAVPEDAPTILMAHEPDYFAEDDPRPALQVSGHTHAGQVNLFGWRPLTPSRFGGRYAHGLHARGAGRLVVSGGLGYTAFPLRIAAPPEIVLVGLTGIEEMDPWTTSSF